MRARRQPRTLVVPVLGGDITDAVLDHAADEARGRGARLVILHLAASPRLARRAGERVVADHGRMPRWRLLAAAAPHSHVFVETMVGDPVRTVVAELERFPRASVMLGAPDAHEPHAAWAREVIEDLADLNPRRTRVVGDAVSKRRASAISTLSTSEPSAC